MLGLLPLLVSVVVEDALVQKLPGFKKRLTDLLQSRPDLANQVCRYSIATTSIAAANNIVSSYICTAWEIYKELLDFAVTKKFFSLILSDLSP